MVFLYVGWDELEPKPGQYAFDKWEQTEWNSPLAKGKRIVFRVILDWPGKSSHVPHWLLESGVKTTHYDDYGGGNSPDYNDPRTVAALEKLITALGKRYDTNPRVGFVQFGMLGFWGEWHTYPRTELFATEQTQRRILDAATKAFPHKQIMTRYPTGYAGTLTRFGFFDDSFPYDTDGPENWKFLPKLRASGRQDAWKTVPFGGEMSPGDAVKLLGSELPLTKSAAETAHFTWIGPYCPALDATADPEFSRRSEALVRRMGYEFQLKSVTSPAQTQRHTSVTVTIDGANTGVAPFYYRWPVEFALLDSGGKVAQTWTTITDLRKWLPGSFTFDSSLKMDAKPGTYKLAIGIRDPWTNLPGIGFANAIPRINGWTILTDLTVR